MEAVESLKTDLKALCFQAPHWQQLVLQAFWYGVMNWLIPLKEAEKRPSLDRMTPLDLAKHADPEFVRWPTEWLQPWMERAGLDEAPLEFNAIARIIESVQERVEGYNFDIRKHVLEYDDVVNKQREVVYNEREKILSRADLHDDLMDMVESEITQIVQLKTQEDDDDLEAMLAELRQAVPVLHNYKADKLRDTVDN